MHAPTVLAEIQAAGKELRGAIPDVYRGFSQMHDAAMKDGALDRKTKELIALAIGVVQKCDGCIGAHARGAALHGAIEQEVAEALGVAILMSGGPATVYGPRAFVAFKGFAAKDHA